MWRLTMSLPLTIYELGQEKKKFNRNDVPPLDFPSLHITPGYLPKSTTTHKIVERVLVHPMYSEGKVHWKKGQTRHRLDLHSNHQWRILKMSNLLGSFYNFYWLTGSEPSLVLLSFSSFFFRVPIEVGYESKVYSLIFPVDVDSVNSVN